MPRGRGEEPNAARMLEMAAERRRAQEAARKWWDPRDSRCPGCGSHMISRWMVGRTLLVCEGCSFAKVVESELKGAVPMGERYPTKPRRPVVYVDLGGRILGGGYE